jgi:hypothetical protein
MIVVLDLLGRKNQLISGRWLAAPAAVVITSKTA